MHIVYLHQYFNTPEMAGSTRSFEIGRRLVACGHSVDMVTSWREPIATRDWFTSEVAGMRVHWLPVAYSNHLGYRARIMAFLKFAAAAARRAAFLSGDVVYATSTPLTIGLPAMYAARRGRIPMVFEVRDLWPELPIAIGALTNPATRALARWLERFCYAHASKVVALSPGMAAGVAGSGYPAQRIEVIPNGSDLEPDPAGGQALRRALGIAPDKIVVGYAGTFGRINGVRYLVELAAALREMAQREGLLDRTLLMPPQQPKGQMAATLSAVDVATSLFLPLPEMESNSANKFFDALACGCCVAINYGGWQEELLRESGAGLRLDRDPRRAAAQLQQLAQDADGLRDAGHAARALALGQFSFDQLAARVEKVLQAACADRGDAPGRPRARDL